MNGWETAPMSQVGGGGVSFGGARGMRPWQPQMQDVVGFAPAADPQFVLLRSSNREKIFQFMERRPCLANCRWHLSVLTSRIEEILFKRFPNKMEYYNMFKGPIEPHLMFAIKVLRVKNQEYRQNQQSLRQIASSPGYEAMNLTSNIMQETAENSEISYVPGNVVPLSSGADMALQNIDMGTLLPEGAPDGHVYTIRHDRSRVSNNNLVTQRVDTSEASRFSPKATQARPAPMKDLSREPKFNCLVCMNEMVDASSTICGHIFCKKCIEASIQVQKKCPTCRWTLTMSSFHRVYLPALD